MMKLSESAGQLTVYTPAWLGLLMLAMGIALGVYVFRGKAKGKVFGAFMAAFICVVAGWHFLYSKATFDASGIVVRNVLGSSHRATWDEVVAVDLRELKRGRGGPSLFLVFLRRGGPPIEVGVGSLPAAPRLRLIEYAQEQVKK